MKTIPFSKIRKLVVLITLLILSGGIGYSLGERRVSVEIAKSQLIINQTTPPTVPVDFSQFWDVWQRLHQYYLDASTIDNQKMVWGAISGMVGSLDDPYTMFLPPKDNESFKQDLGGEFDGIGAQLGMKEGKIIIVAPLKGSPAVRQGIKSGDWIIKVDGEDTVNWTIAQAVNKIRGRKGSTVTLNILHEGADKPVDVPIVRDTITVPSVDEWVKKPSEIAEIKNILPGRYASDTSDTVAYIHLSRFGDRLSQEWVPAVTDILAKRQSDNIKGLIFDLRDNPGGYLDGSVYIASEFLKNGVVVSQVNSDGSKQDYSVDRAGRLPDIPLIVLINKGSASAAEIVSGALKDYKRATIVGETSFGKGSVQTPQDLPGGAGLHITTGKWLTPKGNSINKKGIDPDVTVSSDMVNASADGQLAKAVELLLQ